MEGWRVIGQWMVVWVIGCVLEEDDRRVEWSEECGDGWGGR